MNEPKDIVDELAELADQSGASAEVISTQTEEGVMLIKSFGGLAATLKYPM
jgi:peptide chain release factor subunit 1